MNRLGLNMQTSFGMPPVEWIELAAELGCDHVSTALSPVPWKLEAFTDWSLRTDAPLRRNTKAAIQATGVAIGMAEGFIIRPQVDAREFASDLDIFAELGSTSVSSISMDADTQRTIDQLALLAELAAQRAMTVMLEFAPPHPINNLPQALSVIRQIGKPDVCLLIDTMHFFRAGASIDDLTTLEQRLIGYVQLSDAPLLGKRERYLDEACFERLPPGEGELPLAGLMAKIPSHVRVGIEVPNRRRAANEQMLRKFAADCVNGTYALIPTLK